LKKENEFRFSENIGQKKVWAYSYEEGSLALALMSQLFWVGFDFIGFRYSLEGETPIDE